MKLILVPATIYAVQNNLLYFALSSLDAVTFQIVNQTKIVTTAFFASIMLGKRYTWLQLLALIVLVGGVVLVQSGPQKEPSSTSSSSPSSIPPLLPSSQPVPVFFGFVAVLLASFISGFASCFLEKMLKAPKACLWTRNIQLSSASAVFCFMLMLYDSWDLIIEDGILQGYTSYVWLAILLQSIGGIVVSLVLKYADSVLKGFGSALSVICTGFICVIWLNFHPTHEFLVGSALVLFSVILFSSSSSSTSSNCAKTPTKVVT